ncbi:MAG: CvpA family protein [Arcobacteraceae bacterium]|nr:CvpA family protein [Arcobacteraceae bacterium]
MENINIFDVIVLSLVTLLGLKGLFRGFIKEVFALFGIVGGVFVASRLSSEVGEIVDKVFHFDNNNTLVLVGFVVAIAAFWILAYVIGMALSKVFSLSGLGIFDRLLGFIFGAGKVFLLFSIIAFAISSVEAINKKLTKKLANSVVFPILKDTGKFIIKLDTTKLEKGVTTRVNGAIQSTKDTLKDISTDKIKKKVEDKIKEFKEEVKKETKE